MHPNVRLAALSLLLLLLHAASAVTVTVAQQQQATFCSSVPYNTLSLSCDSVCKPTENACIVYAAKSPSPCGHDDGGSELSTCYSLVEDDRCQSQCFATAKDPSVFHFYVVFTNGTNDGTGTGTVDTGTSQAALGNIPYESNAFLWHVAPLQFDAGVTKAVVAGGLEPLKVERGRVVKLQFADGVFGRTSTLESISLVNIDLRRPIARLIRSFPLTLKGLDLSNSLMRSIPLALHTFTKLERLFLNRNYIATWPSLLQFPALKELHLRKNELTRFDAIFPSLVYLDLRENPLEAFPRSIFNMSELRVVKLQGSPGMAPVRFTSDQFEKLFTLTEFQIDSSVLDVTNCPSSDLKQLPAPSTAKVCVVGGPTTTTRPPQPDPPTDITPAPSPGSDAVTSVEPMIGNNTTHREEPLTSPSILLMVLTGVATFIWVSVLTVYLIVRWRRKQSMEKPEQPAAATSER